MQQFYLRLMPSSGRKGILHHSLRWNMPPYAGVHQLSAQRVHTPWYFPKESRDREVFRQTG